MSIYQSLFDDLPAEAIVLTPNQRLSAFLAKEHQHCMSKKDKAHTWQSSTFIAFDAWLKQLSQQLPYYLLTQSQELLLWTDIINNDSATTINQTISTAKLAQTAWQRLYAWQIDIACCENQFSEDQNQFAYWAKQLRSVLRKNTFLTQAELPAWLTENIASYAANVPQKIILCGFTELTPAQASLLQALETNTGCALSEYTPRINTFNCYKASFPEFKMELTYAAHWIKQQLANNSTSTIACVIPELNQQRDLVEHIFNQMLPGLYNISAGISLNRYPMINIISLILSLSSGDNELESYIALLRSSFIIANDQERIERHKLELLLRQYQAYSLPYETVLTIAKQVCPKFSSALTQLMQLNKNISRLPREWAEFIQMSLDAMGWPGPQTLTSHEYQTLQAWHKLLDNFAQLNWIYKNPITWQQAYTALQLLLNSTIFQAKTDDRQVQVLGTLEAAGLSFDYVWITSLEQTKWPPSPQVHPFIPVQIQREQNMPHATPEREQHITEQLFKQLTTYHSNVVASYSEFDNEVAVKASYLIENYSEYDQESLCLTEPLALKQLKQKSQESISDQNATPLADVTNLKGGSYLLKLQAACPFRAFAETRLHSQALPTKQLGINARERGTLLHNCLESIWGDLHDQHSLLKLSSEHLSKVIVKAITKASKQLNQGILKQQKKLQQLEFDRLHNLLTQWLTIEKQRQPFAISSLEEKIELEVGGLKLNLRADRIDVLPDGKQLIIDYKSGRIAITSWFDNRLSDPQLPLYAITQTENTAGLLFAQIRPSELCFKGVTAEPGLIDGVPAITTIRDKSIQKSWPEQIELWHEQINQLANEYKAGIASVTPAQGAVTCSTCHLQGLCRINEQ